MRMRGSVVVALLAGAVLAGCSIRLGGRSPEAYSAVVARAGGEDANATAARLRPADPELVLLAADRDSAWFAGVAQQLGLKLSGPGRTGASGLAFLTKLEAVGDTSLALEVPGGGRIHMHDALFAVDKQRHIDLMIVQVEPEAQLREAVRTLLAYYASDVGGSSAVVLAVEMPTPQAADSVGLLLRSAFGSLPDCGDGKAGAAPAGNLRVYYGPQARIDCERGRVLSADPATLAARVIVGR